MRNHKVKPIIAAVMALLLMGLSLLEGFGGKAYAAGREIMATVAGSGSMAFSGDGGPATSASLYSPRGMAIDSNGNLYIADSNNNRVRRIDKLTGHIITVAGNGQQGYGGDGGLATSAQLIGPTGLALDSVGNLYIAAGQTVRKVDTSGVISTVAGDGSYGKSGDGGLATSAKLSVPNDVAVDSNGNLYIADMENNSIRKVDTSGIIHTVAGGNDEYYGGDLGDGGLAASAELHLPWGVAVDENDNLYIVDTGHSRIRKVDTSGIITTVAGNGSVGYGGDGGPATSAPLGAPRDVTFDNEGNLYIADFNNHRIRKVEKTTGTISTVAGNGSAGYSGDGGPPTSAQLNYPYASAIDGNGYLYIADATNHRIRRVGPSNNAALEGLTLSSGSLNPAFAAETTGYLASLANDVSSITVTPTVSDSYATVTVNGMQVGSGSTTSAISLSVGDAITIVVTAEDGTTRTYTVTRAISSNANLSGLTLSSGSLSPSFGAGTTSYTASVANGTSSITVTPTVSDSYATVKVSGTPVTSGSASGTIGLGVGDNPITVEVTAQDGTTKTYTLTVTRELSSNANLSGLTLSSGSLSPSFGAGTTSYTASVANGTSSITVTPTVSDSAATVKVSGTPVTSGSASGTIGLGVGDNPITVEVTAQDGTTTSEYTVTVTRAAATIGGGGGVRRSNDTRLNGLTLSSGSLSPSFASDTTSYKATVAHNVNSITLTSITTDRYATVKVNGTAVSSDSASGEIALSVGDNTISITVTAEDGTTKAYTVTLTRASNDIAPPIPRGPLLNEKIVDAPKVREAAAAALQATAYKPFGDVTENSWSFEAVQTAQRLGIVQGRADGSFHGGDSITRAEFATMVVNALYLNTASGASATFSDTKGHWAEPAIRALAAAGVIEGVGDGAFKPNQPISRAEISAILARLMVFEVSAGNALFTDTDGSWARQWIELLAGVEVVKGGSDGRFDPSAYGTREQAVAMILRMLTVCRNVDLQWAD